METPTTITTTDELREHMGHAADGLNIFLATSTLAHDDGDEMKYLSYATTFQIEGYVLMPRKLIAIPVEIITTDRDDADYILGLVRTSQAPLAERQADAVALASQRLPHLAALSNNMALCGLGEMVDAKQGA